MLKISENVAGAFHAQGLRALRQRILTGWHDRLRRVGGMVGEEGRNRILGEIDSMSLNDPATIVPSNVPLEMR